MSIIHLVTSVGNAPNLYGGASSLSCHANTIIFKTKVKVHKNLLIF